MFTYASCPSLGWWRQACLILLCGVFIIGLSPVSTDSIDCGHGKQIYNGECECENCWSGEHCDQYAHFKPQFLRENGEEKLTAYARIYPDTKLNEPLYKATAVLDTTASEVCSSEDPCPCTDLHYSFGTGNDRAYFTIDNRTGEVMLSQDFLPIGSNGFLPIEDSHTLNIIVSIPDTDLSDEMWLNVQLSQSVLEEGLHGRYMDFGGEGYMGDGYHHVQKRAAISLPDNITFTLTKTGVSENTTQMRVGTRVSFQLQILFPQTTSDMLVELFAPDNDSMVMMLCDVKVLSVGSNLQVAAGFGQIVMDSQNSSNKYFDRAIIDFGNVTNGFTEQTQESSSSIYITWDAVMIQNDGTVNDAVYWVSAGAEYNYEMEVWVGQASFTAKTDTDPASFATPSFNLTGPDTMQIGQSAVFTLDMYITQPSVFLSVDAFAPLNNTNVMSVCGMQVVDTGANYLCGFKPEEHVASFYADDNTRGNGRARLSLGVVTNKGARESNNPTQNNRITVQFVVHVYSDTSYVGQSYWVGAAVEIGTNQIWAGEILVTIAALSTGTVIAPTWQITKAGNGKVSTVSPLLMSLDITIPQNTVGKYALEVLAPFNDSAAVYQLCAMRIVGVGENLKCTDTNITPMYSSRGNPAFTDRIYADLGTISNVGSWGWQPFNLTNANAIPPDLMRIEFLIKVTNHTLATVGSEHGVTLGLIINDNRLLVGSYKVEIEQPSDLPNITAEMTPEWNLTWNEGDGNIKIGGAGQFLVTITTKDGVVYSPFDLEALMPNSTGATQVSICKVQVHSIGANLPCAVASAINASVTYTSLLGDGLNDRGVLNLPSLCNYKISNDTAQDDLALKVSFLLQPDAGLTNNQELWPSMGVMFSPYKMWVGQIKAIARDDLSNSANAPHVVVLKKSGDVPVGYVASYNIHIKSVPGDVWVYTLNVSVSSPGLSVCTVKIVSVGDNMPCTNSEALEAFYEADTNGANVKGSLDFGSVSNIGTGAVATNDDVDDNTIVVEVLIGVTPDTAVITDGSPQSFSVQVDYGSKNVNPSVPSFTAVHDQSSINNTAANVTNVEFSVLPITDTDNSTNVVLGQSKLFQLCVWTMPGQETKLSMKMLTPTSTPDVLEAVYIGASSKGKNLPCPANCNSGVIKYESRSGSSNIDIASVNFGYVPNNNFDTTDVDANKLCVDGVFRVLKNEAVLTPGSTVEVSAAVNVNDVEITIVQIPLTVVDNSTFTDSYPENMTLNNSIVSMNSSMPDPLCMTPGDVQTFPFLLNVPPFVTSIVNIDIKLQVDQSACMTYKDMRLISVGKNLRGFGKDYDLQCTANSSLGTSQMDGVYCSLGVVTNPGMSQRCQDEQPDDDIIYLEADLQMADCLAAVKDANITASFGFKVAGYIAILNYMVKVCRTGTEVPVYNITALANSTGNEMYISYDVALANTSQAEVYNTTLFVMPPPYVTCNNLASSSGTNMAPTLDTSSADRLAVEFGAVYFTDAINLVVRCEAKSGYTTPTGVNGHYTVLPHDLAGDVIPRAVSTLPSNTIWSDIDFVNVTATTVSDSGVSCTSASLEMQNANTIFDCQITGSLPSLTAVTNGRKGGTGWTPYVRDGALDAQRYIQVYFPNKVLVDRVEVDQTGASKATEIKLAYSNDGRSFLDGDTITLAGQASEIVQVANPQESQVFRIYITKDNLAGKRVTLAFELYGCETSSGGPSGQSAVCTAAGVAIPTQSKDSSFYYRSFLTLSSSGTVFVCDGVVKTKGTQERCFKSVDGTVWQPLDPRVASMVGHDPEIDRVYALSEDGVTYMSSGDQGQTWESTHSQTVTAAKGKSLFEVAKDVPWTDDTELPAGTPQTSYRMGTWGASYGYLQKNSGSWNNKVKWNCC